MFVNKIKINIALISTASTATTINVPIDMDNRIVDQSDIIETEFVDKQVDLSINPILDYEKVRYLPLDLTNKHIDKIIYDVKLLDASSAYTGFYGGIGFTDDDIQFRKNNFKETFLNLSFYDTPNPLTQKLIANMTLFSELNTSDFLPLSSTSGAPGSTKPANQIPLNFIVENPILNPRGFSEGYHLYMYKDELTVGLAKYIFMRASFKNAKTGKSINLMVKNTKLPINKLVNELYTRYRLVRYSYGYFYEIDNNYNGNGERTPNNVTYTNNSVSVKLYQITAT